MNKVADREFRIPSSISTGYIYTLAAPQCLHNQNAETFLEKKLSFPILIRCKGCQFLKNVSTL